LSPSIEIGSSLVDAFLLGLELTVRFIEFRAQGFVSLSGQGLDVCRDGLELSLDAVEPTSQLVTELVHVRTHVNLLPGDNG
jgi:hypothetical protein